MSAKFIELGWHIRWEKVICMSDEIEGICGSR
jgi:hypothetical protein